MAALQPQRVQHFTRECFVNCYTIFLLAPESIMDIIQLHRIKKKHLKNKQRNTMKYILKKKKKDSVPYRCLEPMGQAQS